MDDALQNKCICNESGSECGYKQAGELKAADSGRQRQAAADSRQQVVGEQ